MMRRPYRILAPCGILGYGFPDTSFEQALAAGVDAIVVDAGSTDAGPHKLGAGVAIVSKRAYKKDLGRMVTAAKKLGVPCLVGSAGGSGAKKHVNWTLDVLREIAADEGFSLRVCVIWADIPNEVILEAINTGDVKGMSSNVPALTAQALEATNGVVAQMGYEPILEALRGDPDVIICGRAYDPAPFAAVGVLNGFDPALCLHMGKILECGALCAQPGTTKDCIIGELHDDHFIIRSPNPQRRVTALSVAAHTFYEKDHPYLLQGPGFVLDLSQCSYEQLDELSVKVSGSTIKQVPYEIKLEGAALDAYRTFVLAGIRDQVVIERLVEIEESVKESVAAQFADIDPTQYSIHFTNYGINGVMGALEPEIPAPGRPYEVGVLMDVVANTQVLASTICSAARSTFVHYGFEGRKCTAGNLAFAFAPSDVEFGPVYKFSVYHLMRVEDGCRCFPQEWMRIGEGD